MQNSRRQQKRLDLSLQVNFRSTYGAKDFTPAMTANISDSGMCINARDFKFLMYEYLELQVCPVKGGQPETLLGDVVWKKHVAGTDAAGIKFRMKDRDLMQKAISAIMQAPETETHPQLMTSKLGISRHYYDSARCRVTFRLLRDNAGNAGIAAIVGDFNNWNHTASPMTRLHNGDFAVTLDLDCSRHYRFRYLIDGRRWENDWFADRYEKAENGQKVSVIDL